MWLLKIPILPFALGVYLPLSLSTATMVGAVVRAYVNRNISKEAAIEQCGILLASGLIGGDACIGIVIAILTIGRIIPADASTWLPDWGAFATFALLAALFAQITIKKR
jgi:uncharacterized oligopeptide transporter (OPT) family protein